MYQGLSKTPFVSLYSCQMWAEDLAEFVAFYHLHHKLGQPYSISVLKNGKTVYRYEPFVIETLPECPKTK